MPLNKASGEPAIDMAADTFMAGSPDALFKGMWDATDSELGFFLSAKPA